MNTTLLLLSEVLKKDLYFQMSIYYLLHVGLTKYCGTLKTYKNIIYPALAFCPCHSQIANETRELPVHTVAIY